MTNAGSGRTAASPAVDRDYTDDARRVIEVEREHLRHIRPAAEGAAAGPDAGLALSGGGIRSAAFALGVMHALVRYDLLRRFDYLSTVSGGGYAGTALTWMLSTYPDADVVPNSGTAIGHFPLSGWRQGVRASVSNQTPDKQKNPLRQLDHIRQRAEYLTPGDVLRLKSGPVGREIKEGLTGDPNLRWPLRLDTLSVIGVVLRSMIAGTGVYLPLLLLLMLPLGLLALALGPCSVELAATLLGQEPVARLRGDGEWAVFYGLAAASCFAVFAGMALAFSALSRLSGRLARIAAASFACIALAALVAMHVGLGADRGAWVAAAPGVAAIVAGVLAIGAIVLATWRAYAVRTYVQWIGGHLLRLGLFLLLLASLPVAIRIGGSQFLPTLLAGGGALGGVLRLVLGRLVGKSGRVPVGLIAMLAGLALCYGMLLIGYLFADAVFGFGITPRGLLRDHAVVVGFCLLGWVAVSGTLMDINYVTPHRMYRDRLMEAFLPPAPHPVEAFKDIIPERANLADMCGAGRGQRRYAGPYHLINANVVLTGSRIESRRGRGGDNFLLSPLWCGSTATGWRRTERYGAASMLEEHAAKRDGGSREDPRRTITVASAMAISAAAANPNAGGGGRGVTRAWPIAFLMNFLCLRLGYSEVNPWRPPGGLKRFLHQRVAPARPSGLWPGLPHLVGAAYTERDRFVELTDGGHFDNLGLYELLRRELPLIVCVDAGQDGAFAFADLAIAMQRARVDFGVNIDFLPGFGLDELTPSLAGAGGVPPVARRGFALAEIRYAPSRQSSPRGNEPLEQDPPQHGLLIYVKSTVVAGLPADLLAYRAAKVAFPHETTADQFFDEAQFEAYRELGYRLASATIKDPDVSRCLGAGLPDSPPSTAARSASAKLAEMILELKERADAAPTGSATQPRP